MKRLPLSIFGDALAPSPIDLTHSRKSWTHQLKAGDRTWMSTFTLKESLLTKNSSPITWVALIGALFICAFISIYLVATVGRSSRVEREVKARTDEIRTMTTKMVSMSKMTALGEMAGGVAHEVNSPLSVISLRAEMLKTLASEGPVASEEVIQFSENIEKTVFQISSIMKGLLSFARGEEGDAMVNASIGSMINDTLALSGERFRRNGVALEVDMTHSDLVVPCRPTQIEQVILNLLNNAYDVIKNADYKWIRLSVRNTGTHAEISITDSGKGIPKEVADKIFQPFFTTKDVGAGTGLGLSISLGLVVAHKGTLTLDRSSPNTRFVITLPLA